MSGIPMRICVFFFFFKKAFLLVLKRLHLQVFARRCRLVCDQPLSAAAHVHACMSLWPGEGCALHFNIPSLARDVCKGFSLFLFSGFPPRSPPTCAASVSICLIVLWERGITLCIIPPALGTRVLKSGSLLNLELT